MTEYSVDLTVKVGDLANDDDLGAKILNMLEVDNPEIISPAIGQNFDIGTVGIACNIEAETADLAIASTLNALYAAIGINNVPVIEVDAHPYTDPTLEELVSQAEIARRLKLSTTRVNQLVGYESFPEPKQATKRALYRWGDVLEWDNGRKHKAFRSRQELLPA